MVEVSKGDAVTFAASVRKTVDALVAEGFSSEEALRLVLAIYSNNRR